MLIQINGDKAYAVATLHARHYEKTAQPGENALLFGHYEFWFDRTEDGWKVNKFGQINRTKIHTSEALKHV